MAGKGSEAEVETKNQVAKPGELVETAPEQRASDPIKLLRAGSPQEAPALTELTPEFIKTLAGAIQEIDARSGLADGASADKVASVAKGTDKSITDAPKELAASRLVPDASDKTQAGRLEVNTPIEDFVKTEPVKAVMLTEPTPWVNKIGTNPANWKQEIAQPGDFKIYEKNGIDWYVVKGEQFRKTYSPNPGFHRSRDGAGLPSENSPEFIKLGITKAQQLPEGEWRVGEFEGKGGDYLLEDWQGKQYIVPKKEFEELYSRTKASIHEAESLRIPKPTGPRIPRPELGEGIESQPWEKGHLIYDTKRGTLTLTNKELGSMSTYNVDPNAAPEMRNRLIVQHQLIGDHLHTRTMAYDLAPRLAATEEAQKLLAELYKPGSAFNQLEQTALALPNTMTEEFARSYDQTEAGKRESRAELQKRLENERIKELVESGAKKVGWEDLTYRPRLDLVIGLPAAGKSTFIEKLKATYGSAEIESDLIKERMPEFNLKPGTPEYERLKAEGITVKENNGLGATSLMQESNLINDRILEHMMKQGYNIVLPGVGLNKEWTASFIKDATARGYDVHLSIIDTAPTDAISSAVSRYERQGRYVNPRFIGTHGERPSQNFAYLAERGTAERWLEGYKRVWNQGFANRTVESAAPLQESSLGVFETRMFRLQDPHVRPVEQAGISAELIRKLASNVVELPSNKELSRIGNDQRDSVRIAGVLTSRKEIANWVEKGIPERDLERIIKEIESKSISTGDIEISRAMLELRNLAASTGGTPLDRLAQELLAKGEQIVRESQSEKSKSSGNLMRYGSSAIALMAIAAAAAEYGNLFPQQRNRIKSELKKLLD